MRPCRADVIVCRSAQSAAMRTAELIRSIIVTCVADRGECFIAVPGGSSPKKVFEYLAEPRLAEMIPWNDVHFFFTDERCVPIESDDSNYKLANDLLFCRVGTPQDNVHRFHTELPPAAAADRYEGKIRSLMGNEPQFDLILLGMGTDTHTASLFPETAALEEKCRFAVANEVRKLGSTRLTLTYPVINNARNVFVLVPGRDKAEAVREALQSDVSFSQHPIQAVQPAYGRLLWILDSESASLL